MDTDRNLLFGVLALQADLLSPERFAEACSAWAGRKRTPLAALLVERGWLSPCDGADIDKLLQRKLAKHQGDARAGLAEVTTDPIRQSLAGVDDADVRQSLAASTPPQGHVLLRTTAYVPTSGDRYTLSRLHATGGIGRVWLAHDAGLGRDVALKELRPERADQPALWARFLREAQVTGQLEHPGIVPVYEVGRRPDEQPFYTMRFVRGRTLAEAAADYHQRRRRGQAGPLELRELLTAFVGVCQVVAYAHSRGVLHRDLKPQNVILGDYGEVVLLDWGLAKVTGAAEGEPAAERGPVALAGEGSADETVAGQVLGTPAYMAPEQAEGRLDLLNAQTDVYGLGAVLYEVLYGQPPFSGPDTTSVLRRVVHEAPVPPRALVQEAPRALEAVCLKALAKRPPDRYGSARELAREVQCWLADEPVAAYREPLSWRLSRFARRHRSLVAAAAATLVAVLVAVSVGLAVVGALNRRLAEANSGLEAANARADVRFRQAREAVDHFYTEVSENPRLLRKEPGTQQLRRQLLDRARAYYEQFATEDDPQLRLATAQAFQRLGDITAQVEPGPTAVSYFETAIDRLTGILGQKPDNAAAAQSLGDVLLSLAALRGRLGQLEAAQRDAARSRDLWERQAARPGAPPEALIGLCRSHHQNAIAAYRLGRYQEAVAHFAKAVSTAERLAENGRDRSRYDNILNDMAVVYLDLGRIREALEANRKVLAIRERRLAAHPTDAELLDAVGTSYNNLGNTLRTQRDSVAAIQALKQAVAAYAKAARENPAVVEYGRNLTQAYLNLAGVYSDRDQLSEAAAVCEAAIPAAERLVKQNPKHFDCRKDLASIHMQQAYAAFHMNAAKEDVRRYLEEAERLFARLHEEAPGNVDVLVRQAFVREIRADLELKQGQLVAFVKEAEHTQGLYRQILRLSPKNPYAEWNLAELLGKRSYALDRLGRKGEAKGALDEAVRLKPTAAAGGYHDALASKKPPKKGDLPSHHRAAAALLAHAEGVPADLREGYAKAALHILGQSPTGSLDAGRLKTDPALDLLRGRQQFEKLLVDLAAKQKPGKK